MFFRDIPKKENIPIKKPRVTHGISVPDLRSDGESISNDRTPPSASSSTRSSNQSSNMWTGSLPNLTIQLTTQQQANETYKKNNNPYATFSDNLNHIDEQEATNPIEKKVKLWSFLTDSASSNLLKYCKFVSEGKKDLV